MQEQLKDSESQFLIADQEAFEKKIRLLQEAGSNQLHILTDFDRTLTKAVVNGHATPSIISLLRNGHYLSSEYSGKAHQLFDQYHPIEINEELPLQERVLAMHEWWKKHLTLLRDSGLTHETLKQVSKDHPRLFRDGVFDFLDKMHLAKIPVIIMSASLGDLIHLYLQEHGRGYPNIEIVSNSFEFDSFGKVVGIKEPIVHTLNKHEVILKTLPIFEKIKDRQNVLLLGDSLGDLGMVNGFNAETILSVGFFHQAYTSADRLTYLNSFDALITNDGNMGEIIKIVDQICQ